MKITKYIIVYLGLPKVYQPSEIQEFSALCHAAGVPVSFCIKHIVKKVHPSTFCSPSFAASIREVGELIGEQTTIVFSHPLPADKQRNLVNIIKQPVLDIEDIILTIFAKRARSREGQLQVEYAQYQHLKTKLIRGWTHLERQKGGIGLRGPGETQLELDRRIINDRLVTIKAKLDRIERSRSENRKRGKQKKIPIIALVGYTNAGKSTLFNCLTNKTSVAENQLFMTLDPLKGKTFIAPFNECILVDTVGFIHHLPASLVTSFKATLQEILCADLLVIVHNAGENYVSQRKYIIEILREIGAENIPTLDVLNKVDEVDRPSSFLGISALKQHGIDQLKQVISDKLKNTMDIKVTTIPYEDHHLLSHIKQHYCVVSSTATSEGWTITYIDH